MDTAQLVATELLGADAAAEPCKGIIERCYGTFEEGPHDALPTDVWDPGEDLGSPSEEKEAARCKSAW